MRMGVREEDAVVTLNVSVVPGTRIRMVTILMTCDPPAPPSKYTKRIPPEAVVSAFLDAIRAGCFPTSPADAKPSPSVLSYVDRAHGIQRLLEWHLLLPAMPDSVFRVLLKLAQSGHHLVSLVLTEDAPPDLPRVSQDALAPLRYPSKPAFAVKRTFESEKKAVTVALTFASPVDAGVLDEVRELFRAWSEILYGGFLWPEDPKREDVHSSGFLVRVGKHLSTEIIASLEFVVAPDVAWEALFEGLRRASAGVAPLLRAEVY
jgi:hypothetical protein